MIRARAGVVLPYLPMALALLFVGMLVSPANDKFQFWYAGHLVATGGSPYDPLAWVDVGRYGPAAALSARSCADPSSAACLWAYPPWVAWVFVPFGLLDADTGIAAQSAALTIAGIAGVSLLAHEARLRGASTLAFTLGAALSAPIVWNALLGHLGTLELLGAALATRAVRVRGAGALVAGGALLSMKPHLVLALMPLVAGLLVRWRAWRLLVASAVALGALALAAALAEPAAIRVLGTAPQKAGGLFRPTTWSFAQQVTPDAAAVTAAVIMLAATSATVFVLVRAPRQVWPSCFIGSALALSLVLAPYAHLYDHVLLLPAFAAVVALAAERGGAARYGGWLVIAAFDLVTWYLFLQSPHGDEPLATALVPLATLGVAALATASRRSPGSARPRAAS